MGQIDPPRAVEGKIPPVWDRVKDSNFCDPLFFGTHNFLASTILDPQFFMFQNFRGPKFSGTQIFPDLDYFWDQKLFFSKNCLGKKLNI